VSAVSAPYQPGQAPWPDNQSQRPERPPPIQFHSEEQEQRGSQALAWALRITGLVAVAVISGFAWWYIRSEGGGEDPTGLGGGNTQQQSTGEYEFTAELEKARVDDDCSQHAYGTTQQFFVDNPCDRLTRSAFTTKVGDRTVYVSVSVVEFSDAGPAGELQELTQEDGTGNVSDLVREQVVDAGGLTTLSARGGYASEVQGSRITIVEADYDPQTADGGTEGQLDDVSKDALRLGGDITANGG
jgi:hypothetical protein